MHRQLWKRGGVLICFALGLSACEKDYGASDFFRNSKELPQNAASSDAPLTVPPHFGDAPSEATVHRPVFRKEKPIEKTALQELKPAPPPRPDLYDQWGISKKKEDGSLKTSGELREELRQKYIEKKRQENPDYGTVLNSQSFWDREETPATP